MFQLALRRHRPSTQVREICDVYGAAHRFSPQGRCACGFRDYSNLVQYNTDQIVEDLNAAHNENKDLKAEITKLRIVNRVQYSLIATAMTGTFVALLKLFLGIPR